MKKSILSYAALTLSLLFSSCSDYLNTVPIDSASPETFLTNTDQANSLLAGIYNCFYDDNTDWIFPISYEAMTDNEYNGSSWSGIPEFAKGTQTSSSYVSTEKWDKDWIAIARCNSLIRGMASSTMSQADQAAILAAAKFLRAYYYYDLVMFYGRVPIIDENSSTENMPREDLDKVIAFFHTDIDYAIANLDHNFDAGTANKGAAYAMKLRMAMYEYDYQTAIDCAEQIELLGYELFDNFETLFRDEGIEDPTNKEVLFKINYAKDIRASYKTLVQYHWRSCQTSLDMVESFFTSNGLPIKDITASDGTVISKDPTYDATKPFDNRDPRLHLSVMCPGDKYQVDAYSINIENWAPGVYVSYTGFVACKGANRTDLDIGSNDGDDKILIRYGEVLLSWAEAENELNGATSLVYSLIDKLRERVGMVTLSSTMPGLSQAAMREVIRNERRVELYNEGARWFDIRRWKIAQDVMVNLRGLDYTKLTWYSDGEITDDWSYVEKIVDYRSFNADRDYLWAIPLEEMSANEQFAGDQNPNY